MLRFLPLPYRVRKELRMYYSETKVFGTKLKRTELVLGRELPDA